MPANRLPRDLDAKSLIKALAELEYVVVRQSGSHIRVRTDRNGEHQETIPHHSPLKIGTLNAILTNIARHHGLSRRELLALLNL